MKRKPCFFQDEFEVKRIKVTDNKNASTFDKSSSLEFPKYSSNHLLNNFKQGDVIFGCNMGEYKFVTKKLNKKGYHHFTARDLNATMVSDMFNKKDIDVKNLHASNKNHYHFLCKNYKYIFQNYKNKPITVHNAIQRTCKRMLTDPDLTHTRHFITKDINFNYVFDRTKKGNTNKEIRAVFREYYKGNTNHKILFYDKNTNLTSAPWENDDTGPWKKYKEHLDKKIKKDSCEKRPSRKPGVSL